MKIRQGRKNGHNLYLQTGLEPSESDVCLGLIIDPEVAKVFVETLNSHCEIDAGSTVFIALTGGPA